MQTDKHTHTHTHTHTETCTGKRVCVVGGAKPELKVGQWVVGHGSNGSANMDGPRGSGGSRDPLTH